MGSSRDRSCGAWWPPGAGTWAAAPPRKRPRRRRLNVHLEADRGSGGVQASRASGHVAGGDNPSITLHGGFRGASPAAVAPLHHGPELRDLELHPGAAKRRRGPQVLVGSSRDRGGQRPGGGGSRESRATGRVGPNQGKNLAPARFLPRGIWRLLDFSSWNLAILKNGVLRFLGVDHPHRPDGPDSTFGGSGPVAVAGSEAGHPRRKLQQEAERRRRRPGRQGHRPAPGQRPGVQEVQSRRGGNVGGE